MEYLTEVYNKEGKPIYRFRSKTAFEAMETLAHECEVHLGLKWHMASCYHKDKDVWWIEPK